MSRLALQAVTKRFGTVTAVAPLTLDFPAGSIHALLGENGAGKSTLVRMIAGVTPPSAGSIHLDGRRLEPGDPRSARAAGVGVVHQHCALVGALSVAENLLLGRAEDTRHLVRPAALIREAEALAATHGLDIGNPRAPCHTLPVGTLARIETLRALADAPRVLLLDEPTAVLAPAEVSELFTTLRRLRDGGMLILFVTHKLDEALRLCDAVTVLRGGHLVAAHPVADVSASRLAAIMVGGDTASPPARDSEAVGRPMPSRAVEAPGGAVRTERPTTPISPMLTVRGLGTRPALGRATLASIDFQMDAGEIRGVAGVDGNGQDELAKALAGIGQRTGTVVIAGEPLASGRVQDAQAAGVLMIPSDRQRDGLALELTVAENVLLAAPMLARFAPRGIIDDANLRVFAKDLVREYRVTATAIDQPVSALSGGNQQRIVIGRTLALRPRLLIAVNPTRGLDIAATDQVHATLRRVAADGTAVLLISTDLDEILTLASAVHVLFGGHLSAPVVRPKRETLGRLMAGIDA